MTVSDKHLYEFGSFRLDTREHLLLRNGERVKLERKVFETLVVMIRNSGHLVHKEEFMNQVWPDAVVEENNLEKSISVLRKVLGENGVEAKYIETVRGLGYRFAADVRELDDVSTLVRHESRTSVTVEDEEVDLGPAKIEDGRNLLLSPSQASAALVSVNATPSRFRRLTTLRVTVVSALLIGLVLAGYFLFGRSRPPENVAAIKSIAVLPFRPLNADSNDEYLGLGLTDALITRLGSVNQITVRPTSTVRKYTAKDQDPAVVGRELRVESVLDGSIQKVGDRFRLTLQLVRVADGKHLWVNTFDEKFTDILTVEDKISTRVAEALALKLNGDEKQRLTKRHTEDSEAYQLYLRGQYFWNKRTPEGFKKSKEYFEQAIAKDANCAVAYGGLSNYYFAIAGTEGPREAIPKAREAAARALAIDETLAEPHTVLGFIKWRYDADWPAAEREFLRAIELNPNYELAHDRYGTYLSNVGRSDEALAEVRKAQQMDPFSLVFNTREAVFLYRARQYDQAIELCRKTIELDSSFPYAYSALGWVFIAKGMFPEAISEIEKATSSSSGRHGYLAELGFAYGSAGKKVEANRILAELKELSKHEYVAPDDIALVYASLGEKDQAFSWLDKAIRDRDFPTALKVAPVWDSLRSDARFADLLKRVGLPQ